MRAFRQVADAAEWESELYLLPGGRPAHRMCYLLSYHVKRMVAQDNLLGDRPKALLPKQELRF
jgi:hypothetical protein